MRRPGWLRTRIVLPIALASLVAGGFGWAITAHRKDPASVVLGDPVQLPTTPQEELDPNGNPIVVSSPTPVEGSIDDEETPPLSEPPKDGNSGAAQSSAEGRFVAFDSYASNLTDGDVNGVADVFRRDRATKRTLLVSVSPDGSAFKKESSLQAISGDGSVVAFTTRIARSGAHPSLFVNDLGAHVVRRISLPGEVNAFRLSYNGRFAAATVYDPDRSNSVWLVDTSTGTFTRISPEANGDEANSGASDISSDGRLISFWSTAPIVDGDTNGGSDIFLYDRITRSTQLVSVDSDGRQDRGGVWGGAMSADGRFIVLLSQDPDFGPHEEGCAGNLDSSYVLNVKDMETGSLDYAPGRDRCAEEAIISDDGQRVLTTSWALESPPSYSLWDRSAGREIDVDWCRLDTDGNYRIAGIIRLVGSGNILVTSTICARSPSDHERLADVYMQDLGSREYELVSLPDGA